MCTIILPHLYVLFSHFPTQPLTVTCDVKVSACYHSYFSFCLLAENPKSVNFFSIIKESRGDRVSCNSFYSNPCSVKSIEYPKLLFISSGILLAALERSILELTKS